MKKFENPEIDVIALNVEDVITTSPETDIPAATGGNETPNLPMPGGN